MGFLQGLIGSLVHLNLRRAEECDTLLKWLAALPGERILDIGCGDGYFSSLIARRGADVTGIDVDRHRLALSRRYRQANLECLEMNAEEMDFPEQSFDAAISLCVIEHFEHDDLVLAQVARLLRPGSRFLFSADSLSNPEIREDEHRRHRERFAVKTFYTMDLVREKLAVHGFAIEQARYILTTPFTLSLVRFSWWLDRLPAVIVPLRLLGHLVLGTLGSTAVARSERLSGRRESGLTLLVQARRTVTPQ